MRPINRPGHQALRKGRVSVPNQTYLVTVVCDKRRRRFTNFHAACAVSRLVGNPMAWLDAVVLAWVVMPDHWHALVTLGDGMSLAELMQRIKSLSARAANAAVAERGQVWQPAFHDHALRRDECLLAAARYLVANPVRAGLCKMVAMYPYWDAIWLDGAADPLDP